MRLIGQCTECRRFRYVRVSSGSYALTAASGICEGVCVDCEEALEDRARERLTDERRRFGAGRGSDTDGAAARISRPTFGGRR